MAKQPLANNASKEMADYIRSHLGETLSFPTISKLCGTPSTNAQFELLGPLVKDGVIVPVDKGKALGSKQRPVFHTYRICTKMPNELPCSGVFMHGADGARSGSEPPSDLHPLLTRNGYLAKHVREATAWHDELSGLSRWLYEHESRISPAYFQERSFEIFHDEKLLAPSGGEKRAGITIRGLIAAAGVQHHLNLLPPSGAEALFFLPPTLRRNLTMLIVENHVPFVRLQHALQHGQRVFFGRHVDGVIYGGGSAIAGGSTLKNTERLFSRGGPVRYLYWGDIDRPGIEVYERLAEIFDVELLVGAYEAMLDAGCDATLPSTEGHVPRHCGIALACQLSEERLETFIRVIAGSMRIPQEAVPAELYYNVAGANRLTETLRISRGRASRLPFRRRIKN